MNDLTTLWNTTIEILKLSLGENTYKVWLRPIIPLRLADQVLYIAVINEVFATILKNKYSALIEKALSDITGTTITLAISVKSTGEPAEEASSVVATSNPLPEAISQPAMGNSTAATAVTAKAPATSAKASTASTTTKASNTSTKASTATNESSNLVAKYTFANFVVGNSNRIAYAAARCITEKPLAYNPLFIYGGSGLGKTHLMHAIGNQLIKSFPGMTVLYVSSESFTNEVINAILKHNTEALRAKYRSVDCLIVDDIQFLKGKESTQLEFFHTFNALYNANKQIIIASDRPPKEIETLEERLRTRFEGGMQVDVQAPDLETRIAIIRSKALQDEVTLPNDAVTLLATHFTANVREIEGAYTKLIIKSSILGTPIDLKAVQELLAEMHVSRKSIILTEELIITKVCSYYKVKQSDLLSKKRMQGIAFARQVAMYLMKDMLDLPYTSIGKCFSRNHSTVMHDYEKIYNQLPTDKALQEDIAKLKNMLES